MPSCVIGGIKSVSDLAGPLNLLLIGTGFEFSFVLKNKKQIALCSFIKLIINPFIYLSMALLLNLSNTYVLITLLASASPTATSIYAIVVDGNQDKDLARGAIVVSTLLSIITLMAWIMFIKVFV